MPFHQLNNYAISILFDSDDRIMCSFKFIGLKWTWTESRTLINWRATGLAKFYDPRDYDMFTLKTEVSLYRELRYIVVHYIKSGRFNDSTVRWTRDEGNNLTHREFQIAVSSSSGNSSLLCSCGAELISPAMCDCSHFPKASTQGGWRRKFTSSYWSDSHQEYTAPFVRFS